MKTMTIITFLLFAYHASFVAAQLRPPQEQLKALADQITNEPNNAKLHALVGRAYFQRGREGDATRVNRHVSRAVELDPSFEHRVAEYLIPETAGFSPGERSYDERSLDDRIGDTLRQAGQQARSEPEKAVIHGLAQRMAQSSFRTSSVDYGENLAALRKMFDRDNSSYHDAWQGRQDLMTEYRNGEGNWQRKFAETLERAVARTNELIEEQDDRRDDLDDGEPPNPMVLKNKAFLDYMAGDLDGCVEKLLCAAAAAETRQARAAAPPRRGGDIGSAFVGERPSTFVDTEETFQEIRAEEPAQPAPPPPPAPAPAPAPEPPAEESATAPTVEAPPQPSTEPAAPSAEPTSPPPPSQTTQTAPPARDGDIAEKSLESLEAISNKKVPEPEVERKLVETAATGTVGEPLIIDLNGNGLADLTSTLLPDGQFDRHSTVRFDLDGDGHAERTEWLDGANDGLLAVDLNENGIIDSGRELFGTAWGHCNGFERLAQFDIDGNGVISGRELNGLLIWQDDGDGVSDSSELFPVSDRSFMDRRPVVPESMA